MRSATKISLWILLAIGLVGIIIWKVAPTNSKVPEGSKQWQDVSNSAPGTVFKYPVELATTYIHASAEPPTVVLKAGTSPCAGDTRTIAGQDYCLVTASEGAAGSIYTTYTYTTPTANNANTVEINFILQAVQCANYDEPQKSACETERTAFNPDSVLEQIITAASHTIK